MTRQEKLTKLLAKLQEAESNGDTEVAHADADEVLCEVISTLATRQTLEILTEILATYQKVDKWYA